MTNRSEYKAALKRLDKDIRVCFLYLEGLIDDRFKTALAAQQLPAPKADLREIESRLDSFRKQIDGLRPKVEAGYKLSQDHDDQEKYLKKLAKDVKVVLDEMERQFEEYFKTSRYKEGDRRKIREEKIMEKFRSEWEYKGVEK